MHTYCINVAWRGKHRYRILLDTFYNESEAIALFREVRDRNPDDEVSLTRWTAPVGTTMEVA